MKEPNLVSTSTRHVRVDQLDNIYLLYITVYYGADTDKETFTKIYLFSVLVFFRDSRDLPAER